MGVAVEAKKGGDLRIGYENDVTTVSAVAAIGAGKRFELLALDGDTAVSTMTST